MPVPGWRQRDYLFALRFVLLVLALLAVALLALFCRQGLRVLQLWVGDGEDPVFPQPGMFCVTGESLLRDFVAWLNSSSMYSCLCDSSATIMS